MQTYTIPQGTKELTIETYNDKIVIEFVSEKKKYSHKTHDGVTIYEGDKFWCVNEKYETAEAVWVIPGEFTMPNELVIFSTEQAARQYVAEKKWEPKDGEVIKVFLSGASGDNVIAIFENKYGNNVATGLTTERKLRISNIGIHKEDVKVPATPSEAQLLFDKLAEAGYRWNAEEKKVEKARWRAKRFENYWSINPYGAYESTECFHETDNARYNSGFYFRTRTQAESAFEAVKNLLLNTEF